MKKFSLILAAFLAVASFQTVSAQSGALRSLGNKLSGAARNEVRKGVQKGVENAKQAAQDKADAQAAARVIEGKTIYVSATTGSARADGLSPDKPLKDLQKAIDLAEENDQILVAEGNYLGNMDRGYIESGKFADATHEPGKFISIYGGYSTDFSERDVIRHITKIQPYNQKFTAPLMNINARRPYGYKGPVGTVVIDGFTFDLGENNRYFVKNVNEEATGTPNEGVLTGRFVEPDANPSLPLEGFSSGDEYALHMDVEGNVRISNCVFVNCRDYGISALMGKGHMEVCNNVFVSCRYAACQVKGNTRDADIEFVSLDFHHNTVLFTWTRTKAFEDMGQGFRFMNGIRTIDVHNNIFGCNSNCAVERVYYESNKEMEKLKVSNLYDNYYFANKRDLEIAAMGASSISVPASRIEEAEQIGPKYEGNMDLPEGNDAFIQAIDQPYLEGFMSLKIIQSQSYNANSAANQVNRLFGLNQQGSEIVRPSMYCNKYPWEKAKDLFGKVPGYGAQMPQY
ncbi:MAG: right-handed parallel beta-helix repeat-containing protein [Bacteroidales bacterium]|nr:right-handed parallel beta-helix repeat-containing protein [Bacteroidales bacterium]MBR0290696.1 right-handed parallel beta-helix repeat-containing protein [Bacteroidales bacterium]